MVLTSVFPGPPLCGVLPPQASLVSRAARRFETFVTVCDDGAA
jgi:hypothetical protein